MRLFESEMASCKSASSSGRIASDPPPTQREGASPGQGCGHPLVAGCFTCTHIITRNLITYLWGRSVKTVLPTSCFFGPPFFVFPLCTYREKQRKRQCFFSRLVGSSEKNKEKGNVFFLASSARHDVEDGFILTHAQAAAMRQPPAESHPVSPVQTQWQSSLSRLCTELRETAARRSATLRCSVCRCGCSPRARPWPHCVDP